MRKTFLTLVLLFLSTLQLSAQESQLKETFNKDLDYVEE